MTIGCEWESWLLLSVEENLDLDRLRFDRVGLIRRVAPFELLDMLSTVFDERKRLFTVSRTDMRVFDRDRCWRLWLDEDKCLDGLLLWLDDRLLSSDGVRTATNGIFSVVKRLPPALLSVTDPESRQIKMWAETQSWISLFFDVDQLVCCPNHFVTFQSRPTEGSKH